MKAFGRWSIISILRFVVQFVWSLMLIPIVLSVGFLAYSLITGAPITWVGLSVFIDVAGTRAHAISDIIVDNESFIITSSSGSEISYISLREFSPFALLLGIVQIAVPAYIFYALTILKRPLNAMALSDVFNSKNGRDLRLAALLLIASAPLKYGIDWLSKINFESIMETTDTTLLMPDFDFTLLMAGLICYLFAEVLNQASIMHQEQKLTV